MYNEQCKEGVSACNQVGISSIQGCPSKDWYPAQPATRKASICKPYLLFVLYKNDNSLKYCRVY